MGFRGVFGAEREENGGLRGCSRSAPHEVQALDGPQDAESEGEGSAATAREAERRRHDVWKPGHGGGFGTCAASLGLLGSIHLGFLRNIRPQMPSET